MAHRTSTGRQHRQTADRLQHLALASPTPQCGLQRPHCSDASSTVAPRWSHHRRATAPSACGHRTQCRPRALVAPSGACFVVCIQKTRTYDSTRWHSDTHRRHTHTRQQKTHTATTTRDANARRPDHHQRGQYEMHAHVHRRDRVLEKLHGNSQACDTVLHLLRQPCDGRLHIVHLRWQHTQRVITHSPPVQRRVTAQPAAVRSAPIVQPPS
jgi:hypothetical protein